MAFLALVGGLITGRDLWFNLAYLLGLLLILSFVWAWSNLNWLHLSRLTRTRRTQVGRPLEERFVLRNTGWLPKLWLEVRDATSLPGHLSSRVISSLGPRRYFAWRVTTICRQRGRFQLGPLQLNTSDPFGLFPMSRDLAATSNVVVYPLTFDIHRFALPVGVLPGGDALRRRTQVVTTNAAGVRDYVPGDSFSRIHWRSTARRSRLIVKEFELDPMADIWIVPDMSVFGHIAPREEPKEPGSELPEWMIMEQFELAETTEEYTVSIAASLAQFFLRQDRAVGLLGYGQSNELVQPDRGERQFNRILETLSVLRAEGVASLSDLLHAEMHMFPRGTTVIVVTPDPSQRWAGTARQLSRRGLRVVSVLLDQESFGGVRSSAGVTSLLQANGMVSYNIKAGDNLTAALSVGHSQARHFVIA